MFKHQNTVLSRKKFDATWSNMFILLQGDSAKCAQIKTHLSDL